MQEAPQQVIRIEEQDLVLTVGDVHKLKISTENITGNLKYLSKNPQIVSFDAYGRITALSPGEAEIQVASPDDSVKAACKVLVKEKPSIELSSTEITLEAGSVASVWRFSSERRGELLHTRATMTLLPLFRPKDRSRPIRKELQTLKSALREASFR